MANKRKNIQTNIVLHANTKQNAPHSIVEFFMKIMMKFLKK